MRNKLLTAFTFAIVVGLQTAAAQFPIKIPKIPKINIEKPSSTPDTSSTTGEITSSPSSSNSSSSESSDEGKAIPGAKLLFSTTPFTSGGANRTTFTSSDFVYARLDLGGKTVYDAFGMKNMGARDSYYVYVSMKGSKNPTGDSPIWINFDVIMLVTKSDANKTYLDIDLVPDPSKLTPTWICSTNDSSQYCGPSGGLINDHRLRDVDLASHTFPSDGTYYIDVRVWVETFDAWGKRVGGRDDSPVAGGTFTYRFSMQDGQTLVANATKAKASAENAKRASTMMHAMPDFWGKYPTPPDPNFAPARLVPMIKGAIGQSNMYLKHSIYSYSGPLWVIETNELNIPRFKRAVPAIYIIYKDSKDNACKIGYLEMRQDYAGGGTYGQAYLGYIKGVKDIDCSVIK
jgi:hypothetical protein